MRVRATLKLRNDEILVAREKLGLTQVECAKLVGIPISAYQKLEKMDFTATFSTIHDYAKKIAMVLEIPEERILPPEAIGKKLSSQLVAVREIPMGNLLDSKNDHLLQTPKVYESEDFDIDAAKVTLHDAMEQLTWRESDVIRMRYPNNDGHVYTLEEIGRKYKYTRERVRQIEMKALSKLSKIMNAEKGENT